jgi:hypothetical protein
MNYSVRNFNWEKIYYNQLIIEPNLNATECEDVGWNET